MITIIYHMIMPGGYGSGATRKVIRDTQLEPDDVMRARQGGWVISEVEVVHHQ